MVFQNDNYFEAEKKNTKVTLIMSRREYFTFANRNLGVYYVLSDEFYHLSFLVKMFDIGFSLAHESIQVQVK